MQLQLIMQKHLLFLCLCFFLEVWSVSVSLIKTNLLIPQQSQYTANVQLLLENTQLIPTTLTLSNQVNNTIPTFGDYFDYFYFLSPSNMQCYSQAVSNQSYLYPCSFLSGPYAQLDTNSINIQEISQQSLEDINDVSYSIIVDNTNFPYPQGAYSYSSVNVDLTLQLQILIDPSYQTLGIRLIFINITILVIFLVIIIILICKTRLLNKKMLISKKDVRNQQLLPKDESSQASSQDKDPLQSSKDLIQEELLQPQTRRHYYKDNEANIYFSNQKHLKTSLLQSYSD